MKTWLLALIPAALAGLFSIGPFLWERFVVPKYELEYTAKEIGKIDRQGKLNVFYSVSLTNSGSERLTNVEAKLQVKDVIIDTITGAPESIQYTKNIASNFGEIKIPIFHAKQEFQIALLAVADKSYSIAPYVTSNETAGQVAKERPKNAFAKEAIFALLTAATVLLALAVFQVRASRRDRVYVPNQRWLSTSHSNFIPNAIAYIAAANGLKFLLDHAWNHTRTIGYFGAADFIYCSAKVAADKSDYINALKCFFLVPNLVENEKIAIEAQILKIDPETDPEVLKSEIAVLTTISKDIRSIWDFRKCVDRFLGPSNG